MGNRLGLGIAAGSDPDQLAELAAAAEGLGFGSTWCNDSPAGEGLAQLWSWAGHAGSIDLGVGVLALDRHDPATIAERARELELPLDRVVFGLGAGFTSQPLGVVRAGVAALRAALPGARVAVAAMGPKMCELAGELGDAVLLNWMTPERAAWARPLVEDGARRAGRDPSAVTIYAYVRCAMGPGAGERLAREAGMYMQMPHYRRHFEAMGAEPSNAGVAAADGAALVAGLARYDAVDEPVVRVLSHRAAPDILTVARAAVGR